MNDTQHGYRDCDAAFKGSAGEQGVINCRAVELGAGYTASSLLYFLFFFFLLVMKYVTSPTNRHKHAQAHKPGDKNTRRCIHATRKIRQLPPLKGSRRETQVLVAALAQPRCTPVHCAEGFLV